MFTFADSVTLDSDTLSGTYTLNGDGTVSTSTNNGLMVSLGQTVASGETIKIRIQGSILGEFRVYLVNYANDVAKSDIKFASDYNSNIPSTGTASEAIDFDITFELTSTDDNANGLMIKHKNTWDSSKDGAGTGVLNDLTITSIAIVTGEEEEDDGDDDDDNVVAEQTSTGTLTILNGADFTDEDLYLYINYTLDDDTKSGWGHAAICNMYNATNVINLIADSSGFYSISLVDLAVAFTEASLDANDGVSINWWADYATFVSAQLVDLGTDDDGTYYTFNDVTATEGTDASYTVRSDDVAVIGITTAGAEVTFTLPSDVDASTVQSITFVAADASEDDMVINVYGDGDLVATVSGSFI
ncbi:MAG: hypothetical protein LUH18_05180 [Oscillospiraceae bacterium]|nr:hypothetical protein [Oscillospiraceae bacterium]